MNGSALSGSAALLPGLVIGMSETPILPVGCVPQYASWEWTCLVLHCLNLPSPEENGLAFNLSDSGVLESLCSKGKRPSPEAKIAVDLVKGPCFPKTVTHFS